MADRSLRFLLLGEDRSASSTMDKVGKKAGGLGSHLGGVAKGVGTAFGGLAVGGVLGLGAALVKGASDAASYQQVTAKTAAVIKSTGGAAGVSVSGVKTLAGQLESLSGIDEEAIINGQNLLLTFTNVRNGVGKGNDIFDQATKTITDMSAALGQDTQASAIQLGKALNDPVKGMTALGRVGVSFTAQQKAVNKALVEGGVVNALNAMGFAATGKSIEKTMKDHKVSQQQAIDIITGPLTAAQKQMLAHYEEGGHAMEAQKNILGELNKEFGGAAKAAGSGLTGSIARVKDSFSDLFRNIATPLLPLFASGMEKVAGAVNRAGPGITAFATKAGPAFRNVFGYVQRVVIPIAGRYLGNVLTGLRNAFHSVAASIQKNRPELEQLGRGLLNIGKVVYAVLGPTLKVAFTVLGTTIGVAIGVIAGFVRAFNAIRQPVVTVLGVVAAAFLGVVGALVTGAAKAFGWVPGLGPKLKTAAREFGTFKDNVNSELDKLRDHEVRINVVKRVSAAAASGSGTSELGAIGKVGLGGRASGGPIAAGATMWIGERGPELYHFPRGGSVASASTSRRATGGNAQLHVHFDGPVYGADADQLARKLAPKLMLAMREIRAGGGRVPVP